MQVTLGGNRLGSGKKMQVSLREYDRSTHDLSYAWRSTMSSGTLVPFMAELALPGDTFDIDLNCSVLTHPTIGPLFGSYKVQLDLFECPIRLYNAQLHNNSLKVGMDMATIKLPIMEIICKPIPADVPDIDNSQVNPSSILAYFGIRGVGQAVTQTTRHFQACKLLSYWDIYKNYYANKQEEIGAVIHGVTAAVDETVDLVSIDGTNLSGPGDLPGTLPLIAGSEIIITYTGTAPNYADILIEFEANTPLDANSFFLTSSDDAAGTITGTWNWQDYGDRTATLWRYRTATDTTQIAPIVATFPLENIDKMREEILKLWSSTTAFSVNDPNLTPYSWILGTNGEFPNMMNTQEGLAIKTYQNDLFNNWLNKEWIDGAGGITEMTSIDTSGGSFSIETLNLANRVYKLLNRVMMAGGSYHDWIETVYTVQGYRNAETPMYHGGLIKELIFQEVVSNSASNTEDGQQPLGTLAGKGTLSGKHKGGKVRIKVSEPAYIIGIVSLTPRIDYSQGNKWDNDLKTLDDPHKPQLDEIGFQDLINEQMAWWTSTAGGTAKKTVGKQPAWINYMTNVNQTYGNFAVKDNEMFMTLNRRYEYDETTEDIKDLTTYIDPVKFNNIFAQTSLDAMNFWVQIGVGIEARRVMSAKVMPTL